MASLLATNCDPDELVDLLHISSEELLDRFSDKIEQHYETLAEEFEEQEEDISIE